MSHATSADVLREQASERKRESHCVAAGVMVDHFADERSRRADAMARRYEEVLALFELTTDAPYPYADSGRGARFERALRRATLFDAVE